MKVFFFRVGLYSRHHLSLDSSAVDRVRQNRWRRHCRTSTASRDYCTWNQHFNSAGFVDVTAFALIFTQPIRKPRVKLPSNAVGQRVLLDMPACLAIKNDEQ